MRKSFVALLLLTGAVAVLTNAAFAGTEEFTGVDIPGKLTNAQIVKETKSRVAQPGVSTTFTPDTTFVGYRSDFSGSNYWSIGVGDYRPFLAGAVNQGFWSFDFAVKGDSLQGWWPVRHRYTGTGGLTLNDDQRPWWAIEIGNQVNYVLNEKRSAATDAGKRTFGVTGVWHADPGGNGTAVGSPLANTNPLQPNWAPLGGSQSAWCGLRGHGDQTVVDPITGNAYNIETARDIGNNDLGATGTDRKFPGYMGQWDQMLYRDVTIPTSGTLLVRFKYRSNMSTAVNLNNVTRTGWFDQDPLTVNPGNFVKSSANPTPPIDSFMVYVGRGVEPTAGADNDWTGSDGLDHEIGDLQRRWFGEVVHAQDGTHHEVFTTFGDNAATTQTSLPLDLATLNSQGYAGKARIVFRVHTNRGGNSDDEGGSIAGQYSSDGAGAVVVDDVEFSTNNGASYTTLGTFEGAGGGIDNNTATPASSAWKSTGKPPGVFFHVHDLADLDYRDLCGQPGSVNRICNMFRGVVSAGDHDASESLSGGFGTPEQERFDGVESPTINLVTNGLTGSSVTNNMGLTFDMVDVSEDYYITYEIYTGAFDLFTQGNGWQFWFNSYPATQADGQKVWGNFRLPGFQLFNPDIQCFGDWEPAYALGLIRTSNASGYPDSLRIGMRHLLQCYRFGISSNCGTTLGYYVDNMTLMLVDGAAAPLISVDIWQLIQDTFPANEDSGLPGLAAFDTCGAYVRSGLNIAQTTGNLNRLDIAGDSSVVIADGNNVAVHLVFRVNPGPGNYVTAGSKASGLRKVPANPAAIASGDGSFWATYIANNGDGTYPNAGGANNHGTTGSFATRWNSLAWNAARMDTAEVFAFPVAARNFNISPATGLYATTYHESDPHGGIGAPLALVRNLCFVNDLAGSLNDITCGRSNEPSWPPAWVTSEVSGTNPAGIPVSLQSGEATKIFPDGLFTPGTHVQYFFRREDGSNPVAVVPDSEVVFTQANEGSSDAHRWQQFAVLPDMWKKPAYGGANLPCMLYVDWNDRRGNERVWVSVADSIGATASTKWGAHNGWHAAGGASVNDPAAFVYNKNEQPGTTWDMYGVKAAESLNSGSGHIGTRTSHRESSPAARAFGKDARNAPTIDMLEAYYKIMMITTGDLNSAIFGPFNDKSSNDEGIIEQWLLGATSTANRGLWLIGDGAVEATDGDPWLNNFSVSLASNSYLLASGNTAGCADLIVYSPITTNDDIYGVRNGCTFTDDVLNVEAGGAMGAEYTNFDNAATPYVASVYHAATAPNYWESIVDGFDIENLRSRFCDNSVGRVSHFFNAFSNVFNSICAVQGTPTITLDTPNNGSGKLFVDAMSLANSPLRTGEATIRLSFSKETRSTVKIVDVAGRQVRTLVDGQVFKAGEHPLTWDGADNAGRTVPRGVYFVIRLDNGKMVANRSMVVLK